MLTRRAPRAASFAIAIAVAAALAAPRARAQDADPWFGRDKALHFTATASIAVVGYAGATFVTESRGVRAGAGAGLAMAAGIGKELWDLGGRGDPSMRDLAWDAIGAATGVLVAWTVDWLVRRVAVRTSS
jgi:putative lipoprotein